MNRHQGEPKGPKSLGVSIGHLRFGVLLTSLASPQGTESGRFRRDNSWLHAQGPGAAKSPQGSNRSSQLVLSCFCDHLFMYSFVHLCRHSHLIITASAPFGNCGHRQGPQNPILGGNGVETGGEIGDIRFLSLKEVLHPVYGAGGNKGWPGHVTLGLSISLDRNLETHSPLFPHL